jgi:hypothetical protein
MRAALWLCASALAAACGQTLTSGGLRLAVDAAAGTYALAVDGALWLTGGLPTLPVAGLNA